MFYSNQAPIGVPMNNQKGVIVKLNGEYADSVIYSPISGKALLSPYLVVQPMKLGSFVSYNVYRSHDQKEWIAEDVHYIGEELEIVPYLLRKSKLQLKVYAMVNRMDMKTSSAWLWNDTIGRIRIPPLYFLRSPKPFDIVELIAMYEGEHEDVPWQAVNVTHIRDERVEMIRNDVATLLSTSDGWTVDKVSMHENDTNGFFTIVSRTDRMNNKTSAFAAWTDYTRGESPPSIGTPCRVTLFKQDRIDKNIKMRAVLVTPRGIDFLKENNVSNHTLQHLTLNSSCNRHMPLMRTSQVHHIPMSDGSNSIDGSTMSISSSPTQSEIEQMVDNSRIDDFRLRSNSAASTNSSLSSSPRLDYTSLYPHQFREWMPTEAEKSSFM